MEIKFVFFFLKKIVINSDIDWNKTMEGEALEIIKISICKKISDELTICNTNSYYRKCSEPRFKTQSEDSSCKENVPIEFVPTPI